MCFVDLSLSIRTNSSFGCLLQVSPGPRKEDMPYSFLSVLEHGYFSDLVLRADSGKEVWYKCVVNYDFVFWYKFKLRYLSFRMYIILK